MSLTLTLPPHIESRLRERASRLGLDPAEYVADLVERDAARPDRPEDAMADGWVHDDTDAANCPPGWPDDLSRLSPTHRARLEELLLEGLEGEAIAVTPTFFAERFRERQAARKSADGGEACP